MNPTNSQSAETRMDQRNCQTKTKKVGQSGREFSKALDQNMEKNKYRWIQMYGEKYWPVVSLVVTLAIVVA